MKAVICIIQMAGGVTILGFMNNRLDLNRLLASLGLDRVLPEEQLLRHSRVQYLEPRQCLFQKGDPVEIIYLVLYGSLRMESEEVLPGENVVYAFKRAGCLLGIFAYLEISHRHTASAVSMENTALLEIPAKLFLAQAAHFAPLREEVHRQIAVNFKELQADRDLQRATTAVRLAHFLKRTLDDQKEFQSRSLLMKLTKKDLAKKIGSEPETVVRLLSDWCRKGIIKNKNRTIEICDLDELERLAEL
jgi:CRP-like cAMP-binding protein